MSFHASANDIRVDNGHILKARLGDADREINLNDFIGNNDGAFEWGGNNFSETAEDISFSVEGGDSVPVLRARLKKLDGEYVDANVNLGERISNQDGHLHFA